MPNKNIEVWSDYDEQGTWVLRVKKKRGKLTLDEITEACMDWDEDFYMLTVCAINHGGLQYYDVDDLTGDFATLYRADDFFKWREKQ